MSENILGSEVRTAVRRTRGELRRLPEPGSPFDDSETAKALSIRSRNDASFLAPEIRAFGHQILNEFQDVGIAPLGQARAKKLGRRATYDVWNLAVVNRTFWREHSKESSKVPGNDLPLFGYDAFQLDSRGSIRLLKGQLASVLPNITAVDSFGEIASDGDLVNYTYMTPDGENDIPVSHMTPLAKHLEAWSNFAKQTAWRHINLNLV